MDLGAILTDLGTSYINARYVESQQPRYQPALGIPIPGTGYQIEGDIPFIDIGRRSTGRRRRKPLLTQGDESALLRISSLLQSLTPSQAKTMMPIILKAVRR